jgi:hypothetical protein
VKPGLLLAAGGVAALVLGSLSCRVPNEDHCLHKAVDANSWCATKDEDRPFCSPCEAERHGCVKTEPTAKECPAYSASPSETGGDTGTGTDTGTDTGESGGTGTDGSGTDTGGSSESG